MNAVRREWGASMVMLAHVARSHGGVRQNWLSWALLALAVLAPAIMKARGGEWAHSIGTGASIPLVILAMLWLDILISSLAAHYQGYNRLVPGMHARCSRALLLVACASVLVLGSVICMAGVAPYFAFLGLIVLFSGMFLLHIAVLKRFILVLAVVWLVFDLGLFADVFLMLPDVAYLPMFAVVLGAMAWSTRSRLLSPLACASTEKQGRMVRARQRFSAFFHRSDDALAKARGRAGPGALLLEGLGPSLRAPWLAQGAALALLALLFIALWPQAEADSLVVLRALILMIAFGFQFSIAHSVASDIYRSRGEQAVLRLAARLPSGPELNRVLAAALLRQLAFWWIGSTLIAGALLSASGATLGDLLRSLPMFGLTLIPAGGALRDYSAAQPWRAMLPPLYVVLGLGMMFMVLIAFVNRRPTVFWLAVWAGALLLVSISLWHGWRSLSRAPVALPAGRMA